MAMFSIIDNRCGDSAICILLVVVLPGLASSDGCQVEYVDPSTLELPEQCEAANDLECTDFCHQIGCFCNALNYAMEREVG